MQYSILNISIFATTKNEYININFLGLTTSKIRSQIRLTLKIEFIKEITMSNYFNTLCWREKLAQLGKCRFMGRDEFASEANFLKGKKIVI